MYYKILKELPRIPVDMLNATLHYESDSDDPFVNNPKTAYNQRKIIRGNKIEQNKLFNKQSLTPDLLEWIKKNITDKFTGASLAKTLHVEGATLAPHCDRTRKFTLIYLLESGGPEHKTVFYSAKNHSGNYKPGEQFEYNEVEEVDSITIPLHKWTLLNAGVPHSVENIPDMRVAIQLGLEFNPWTEQ